ncbi:hypothetical protein [Nocardia jejuensis]|uniref:hypothetical protein n=1 Tax=Nocardia jejuensis TaxID=328049 RepID=UPI000836085D|nr:hypothetical protein [Nocardia jejuensis]
MILRLLGKGGSGVGECPSLYVSDGGSYVVQGWQTAQLGTVEIPHLLLGFAEPDTFVGAMLTDTGRGTFTLSGRPVAEESTLKQLDMAADERAIEVPKLGRNFCGASPAR